MCEMTVEFIKSETVGEDSVLNELWEEEGNFFSGDGTRECIEQSIIKEYSSYSAGNVFSSKVVYNETMSHLSQKVLNSFNVTGSNWSLRRIISSNISMVYDINSQTSLHRLVKGRIERKPHTPPRALQPRPLRTIIRIML